MVSKETYLENLAKRGKESGAYHKFQDVGIQIAEILKDLKHTALYIKLAKEGDGKRLLALAKDVASRKDVKSLGAYFMKVVSLETQQKTKQK